MAETLAVADAKNYGELESDIAAKYLPAIIPEDIWDRAALIRRDLAPHGCMRAPQSLIWCSQRRRSGSG